MGAVKAAINERLHSCTNDSHDDGDAEDLGEFAAGSADMLVNILLDIATLALGEERVESGEFTAADTTPTMIDTNQDPLLVELCQMLDLDLWQADGVEQSSDSPKRNCKTCRNAGERAACVNALLHLEALQAQGSLLRTGKMSLPIDSLLGHSVTPVWDLTPLSRAIERTAADQGLVIMHAMPDASGLPTVGYQGDWQDFISLAVRVPSSVVYLEQMVYDPDLVITRVLDEYQKKLHLSDLLVALGGPQNDETGDTEHWLWERLRTKIVQWDTYRGVVPRVCCLWCHEGIGHVWQRETEWHIDCARTLVEGVEEALTIARDEAGERSQQHTAQFHELATQMAHHPRFREATSDAKREFMAEQLFGDVLRAERLPFAPARIAARASLIHWWDVDPNERVTMAERARQLSAEGESKRSIAAILGMSEAKVSAALNERQ